MRAKQIFLIIVLAIMTILSILYVHSQNVEQDSVIDILMIGNSFSYHFTDELFSIADAAGVEMNVCNVYYSGCSLEQHWEWLESNTANYKLRIYDDAGRHVIQDITLDQCLAKADWDVISLQDSNKWIREGGISCALEHSEPYMENLLKYISEKFPSAQIYWHQTWAYQVGYNRDGFSVLSSKEQREYFEQIRSFSSEICSKFCLPWIPSGDAWQIARENTLIGDTLCGKDDSPYGDYYHDGTVGGGQYLNACVWFETLTGESCIGNSYRPNYEISEEKIMALQASAHQAVQNMCDNYS